MDYASIRSSIKSGDLIALSHTAWGSLYDLQIQAVRTFTQSEYSHICVAWVIGGRVFVIEAVEPKVRIMPLSNMQDVGFYWIPTNNEMSETELEFGLSKVGIGTYSKIEAIEAQLDLLDIGKDDLWECAELTIAMRKLSSVNLGDKATPAAVVQNALEQGLILNYMGK
jgi:hypothetical protein